MMHPNRTLSPLIPLFLAACGFAGESGIDASTKKGSCGNGKCTAKESCETCPADCGVCSIEDTGTAPPPPEPPGPVAIQWDAPTTNADGTVLTDLKGYRVYYGKTSPVTTLNSTKKDVGNTTNTTLDGLSVGTVYVTVTAYDGSGNESAYASQLALTVN